MIPQGDAPVRPIPTTFHELSDRGISRASAEKYKVSYITDESDPHIHLYPYTRNGKHVANKRRSRKEKGFSFEGDTARLDLFGQSIFPPGSATSITIVEGECDALAAFEMNGGYPVVSVSSASTAERDCTNSFNYLNSFEQIVICFDKDEGRQMPNGEMHYPGQEAAIRVANRFPIGKVRILTLANGKDPNDYLRAGKHKQFIQEWFRAPRYTPAGLKMGSEMWDKVINPPSYKTTPYPFAGLNDKTYGIRLSELVIINAQPKIGKTSILREIGHKILQDTDSKLGLMLLEESNRDSLVGFMSISANKRLHLPDVWEGVEKDELKDHFDKVTQNDRLVLWDHFGSNTIDELVSNIRHMHALGCNYILLDHISILVSDQSGDERKQLDEIATKLKTLTMELNISIIAVVHQSRNGQIRGTQGIEQLANIVIKLERDKMSESASVRNTTKVLITDNRFCGETGLACYLFFNSETGRITEISEAEFQGMVATNEDPWSTSRQTA